MDLSKIGTSEFHIRASSLPTLFDCGWFYVIRAIEDTDRFGNVAAQTGTAIGRAVELWHVGHAFRETMDILSVEAIDGPEGGARSPFPGYDHDECERLFHAYSEDPRNDRDKVTIIGQEAEVRLELPPHEWDETKQPVVIVGHIDQIRMYKDGVKRLWDVKAGRPGGSNMLHSYALQQAAYLLALQESKYAPVEAGGIIRMRGYSTQKKYTNGEQPVFFRYNLSVDDARQMLDSVRLRVAALRAGQLDITPGMYCGYCDAGGLDHCIGLFKETFNL